MSKIAVIGDIHYGVKQNSQAFLKYQLDYFEEEVFPILKKNNVNTIIQMGDFFNSRKSLEINTIHWVKKRFLDPIRKENINLKILLGNHDVYYTKSNEITSLSILDEYENIDIIKTPTLLETDGFKYSMIPWLANDEDVEDLKTFLNDNPHDTIFGHFEFKDFEVVPGHRQENGLNKKLFRFYDNVYSGHFHLKQSQDNIHYLGTPYELTWSDFNSDKGIYLLDTKTKIMEYHKNERTVHCKLFYDQDFQEKCIEDIAGLKGKIVKVFVTNKDDDEKFAEFIYELEKEAPSSFIIIDNISMGEEISVDDEGKGIFDVIRDYIKDSNEPDKKIEPILKRLYNEVLIED